MSVYASRDPMAGKYTYSGSRPYVAPATTSYGDRLPTPPPTPTPPVAIALEPQAYDAVLYGKVMPVFIGGKLLIGGRIIEGPYYTASGGDQLADYVAHHALCADPAEPRTVTEYRLRGQQVWTSGGGYIEPSKLPAGGLESRTGSLTQAALTLSVANNGSGAIAYRSSLISSVHGASLQAFGGIIPFPSIGIQDNAYADGIPRQVAIEKCLRYMRLDDDDFEVNVGGTDSAWIIGSQLTLQDFLQRLRGIFVHYNITYTDKVRIIEPSDFSIAFDLTSRNMVRGSAEFSKTDPLLIPRVLNYSYINSERDNEPDIAAAYEDVYPQPTTSSVNSETVELPIVTNAAQAAADVHVALYEQIAVRNTMEFTGLPSLFGIEVGDGCRFQGDSPVNEFMDKALRSLETQHDYSNWQVQVKAGEVLNCGYAISSSPCVPPVGADMWLSFICNMYQIDNVDVSASEIIAETELITANGLEIPDGIPGAAVQILGDAAAILKACDWTIVLDFEVIQTTVRMQFLWMENDTGSSPISGLTVENEATLYRNVWIQEWDTGNTRELDELLEPPLSIGRHKLAITRTAAKLVVSQDGLSPVTAATGSNGWTHVNLDRVLVGGRWFDGAPDDSKGQFYYREITVYPVQNDVDLPGLSTVV